MLIYRMPPTVHKLRGKPYYVVHATTTSSIPIALFESEESAKEWIESMTGPKLRQPTKERPYVEQLTNAEKLALAHQIRNYTKPEIDAEFEKLKEFGCNAISASQRIRVGNLVVDAFTFSERLNTISKKGLSFYEMWENRRQFITRPYVRKFMDYQRATKSEHAPEIELWYNLYRYYFGSVNLFRPVSAMEFYCRFRPHTVLDPTMGWGGRLVGACAANVAKYIGIDANMNLRAPYNKMANYLRTKSDTIIELYFQDALKMDYSKLDYDMVLTSPPYYNIEIYNGVGKHATKLEWDQTFYAPLFYATYKNLKRGGVYCLNVSQDIYDRVCVGLLGKAYKKYEFETEQRNTTTRKKSNKYKEYVYVWKR